tara:strand:- start:841 stop:1026 length:186 start_codon:yes stop_codon:yes gene_type:complete
MILKRLLEHGVEGDPQTASVLWPRKHSSSCFNYLFAKTPFLPYTKALKVFHKKPFRNTEFV